MTSRRSLIVMSGVLLILVTAVAATLDALPTLARGIAIARLEAITKRPVAIDRVDVRALSGRLTIHGLRITEPDGHAPFADLERLDARLNVLSLVRGHLWVREQKDRAESVARGVPGVERVVSTLEVRTRRD